MKEKIRQGVPFAMVANNVLNDSSISWEAKGLFAYLYSKPEDWSFSASRIVDDSPQNDRRSVDRILKELERAGYLKRERQSTGKMVYYFTFEPQANVPKHAMREKGNVQEVVHISNKENTSNTDLISNKDISFTNVNEQSGVNALLQPFYDLNPMFNFGNKTQRKAAQDLIDKFGFEKALSAAQYAVSIQGERYAPSITTPCQLVEKMGALISYKQKTDTKLNNNVLVL